MIRFILGILLSTTIVGLCLGFLIIKPFKCDDIVSKKPIIPEIKIIKENGKTDTLYVYKNIK